MSLAQHEIYPGEEVRQGDLDGNAEGIDHGLINMGCSNDSSRHPLSSDDCIKFCVQSTHHLFSQLCAQIRVVDSHSVDGSDLSVLEGGGGNVTTLPRGRRAAETGFKNTLLFSGGGRAVAAAPGKVDEEDITDGSPPTI